jgi:hypothetical protein
VSATLPSIFKQRRANRGFEGLAVSDNGRTAYTLTQSPMGSTSAGNPNATPPVPASPYRNSRLIRVIRMDITDPLNLQVTGEFVLYMLPVSDYPVGNSQRDLKISGAAWVSTDKLLVSMGGELAPPKFVVVDLTGATDVKDLASATAVPLVLENVNTDLSALGITPATTRVVLDLGLDFPQITEPKLEGLSILNANEISISSDNDFGIGSVPNAPTKVYTIRLSEPLR